MTQSINWGIIGLGKIAKTFAEALQILPEANLLGVASREKKTAEEFGEKYQVPNCYGSYQEILQNPDIQAIYIATPHVLHYENTLECLEAKKAVLCEKPFAMNLRQVQEMIALARKEQVFLMEALWTKFLPTFQKVKELVDNQVIGNIISIQADFGFQADYQPEGRLFNKNLGGGSLLDVGIYPLFFATALLGKPQQVIAEAVFGKTQVDESCSMILKYAQGAIATLTSSIRTNQTLEANIFGDKGRIRMTQPFHKLNTQVEIIRNWNEIEVVPVESFGNGYNYEAQEVMNCLKAGKIESAIMSHQDSLQLMEILDWVRSEAKIVY